MNVAVPRKKCFSWWKQMQQNQLFFLSFHLESLTYNDQNNRALKNKLTVGCTGWANYIRVAISAILLVDQRNLLLLWWRKNVPSRVEQIVKQLFEGLAYVRPDHWTIFTSIIRASRAIGTLIAKTFIFQTIVYFNTCQQVNQVIIKGIYSFKRKMNRPKYAIVKTTDSKADVSSVSPSSKGFESGLCVIQASSIRIRMLRKIVLRD